MARLRSRSARAILVAHALVISGAAHANPDGVVPSYGLPGAGPLVLLDADYEYQSHSALITREQVGDPNNDPLAPLPVHRQLTYHQTRQQITARAEVGIYHDLWLSLAAPVVLAQSTELDVDGGVDRTVTTTFTDGILPANGYDANNPTVQPGGNVAFRDIGRSGIPEVDLGIGFAPTNQALDDSRPTWKLGAEVHVAVGRVMRFDPVHPGNETGVSTGVDELRLWTSFDRRYRYFESWFDAFWQLPIHNRAASLFGNPGFGATQTDLAQTAGLSFGAETAVLDDPATGRRVTLELSTRITAHLAGRDYSEMWQAFAFAGDARTAGPLVLDGDPTQPGQQALSHPGITNIESYLETALHLAIRGKLGTRLTVSAFADLSWQTEHIISFTNAGVDLNRDGLINPGTAEVNPLEAPLIDVVGHRYHADDGHTYAFGLSVHTAF